MTPEQIKMLNQLYKGQHLSDRELSEALLLIKQLENEAISRMDI